MSLTIVLYLDVLIAASDAAAPINRRSSEVYLEASRQEVAEVFLHKVGVLTHLLNWFLFFSDVYSHWATTVNLMSLNVKLLVYSSDDSGRKICYRLVSGPMCYLRHLNITIIDILFTTNFLL